MPDEDLKKYIPKYGDRAAVRQFCKRNANSLKQSLVEQLRSKICPERETQKKGHREYWQSNEANRNWLVAFSPKG